MDIVAPVASPILNGVGQSLTPVVTNWIAPTPVSGADLQSEYAAALGTLQAVPPNDGEPGTLTKVAVGLLIVIGTVAILMHVFPTGGRNEAKSVQEGS